MQFSVWPSTGNPASELLALTQWAEQHGWFGAWVADHYMLNTGSTKIVPGNVLECWSMLAAMATSTERIRIGSLVSPTSVHHPAVLANQAATVDHLSGGRLVLGLGAGWQINEHHAYGIELAEPKQRVDRFEEAIEIIRSLHTEPATNFNGHYFTITEAIADPKPVQSPLPLLIGTASPRMLRIAARHADEWNTWGGREWAAARRPLFEQACEAVGRDPRSMHTSIQAFVHITANDAERDQALSGPMKERSIAGSVDELVDTIGWYGELGFDEFIVPEFNLPGSLEERLDFHNRLDAEIVAQLR